MKERNIEGVTKHDDPESCAVAREGVGDAWTRAGAGRVPQNITNCEDYFRFSEWLRSVGTTLQWGASAVLPRVRTTLVSVSKTMAAQP